MAESVYVLCGITSFLCAVLLYRGNKENPNPLMFWSAVGFLGLALSNIILCLDLIAFPERDLSIIRSLPTLIGLTAMIYGLIWETVP
jgi:hypothetical protein